MAHEHIPTMEELFARADRAIEQSIRLREERAKIVAAAKQDRHDREMALYRARVLRFQSGT